MINKKLLLTLVLIVVGNSLCYAETGQVLKTPEAEETNSDTERHVETEETKQEQKKPAILSPHFALAPRLNKLPHIQYAKGIFTELRNDRNFNEKINEIQFGKESPLISENLVEHFGILSEKTLVRLDQLKQLEIRRLLEYADQQLKDGVPHSKIKRWMVSATKHFDTSAAKERKGGGALKFTQEDLRELIRETNSRLIEIDEARKQHFKEYEMHKRLEFAELKKRLSKKERADVETRAHELLMHHKRRKPAHLPFSKAHIVEVWEERDHMDRENINMKTFFFLHDLDNNQMWDENEVRILVNVEASKLFNESSPDFDPRERDEEIERMREYTFKQVDENQDRLITLKEFISHNQRHGLKDTEFWERLGTTPQFTEEEYQKYAQANREEVNRMIDEGLITMPNLAAVKHFLKPEGKA